MSSLPPYWSKMDKYFTVFGLDSTKIQCLSVLGDGNCLYRALSLLFLGDEKDHVVVRAVICFLGLEHVTELDYVVFFFFFFFFFILINKKYKKKKKKKKKKPFFANKSFYCFRKNW